MHVNLVFHTAMHVNYFDYSISKVLFILLFRHPIKDFSKIVVILFHYSSSSPVALKTPCNIKIIFNIYILLFTNACIEYRTALGTYILKRKYSNKRKSINEPFMAA